MNMKTLISAAVLSTALFASNANATNVTASDVWARASAGMAKAGAAFMTLTNTATLDHTLVSASADVSERIELHTHTMVDGVMQMREVEGGIKVPAGETVMLAPGGLHVMFLGLHAPLKVGSTFDLTLTFDNGHSTTVPVKVMSVGHMGNAAGHMGHGAPKAAKEHGGQAAPKAAKEHGGQAAPSDAGKMGHGHAK